MKESSLKNSQKRRILLMYISRVSGHRQAILSIQNALRALDPMVEAPVINGFGYTYPLLEKIINRAYLSVIKRTPQVWDYLYDNPKIFKKSESIKKFLHKTSHAKIERLFKRYRPEAVVCTQAFPCGMVADYKLEHHVPVKLIAVLTDYAPHSYWLNDGVDYYVVPSVESRERFIAKGIPPEKIKIYGIPIRMKFAEQLDRELIADKLGLDLSRPVILIMGGGQGLGPIKSVVKSLLKIKIPLQMIVLTGTNKKLVKWLSKQDARLDKKKSTDPKKILYFDFVKNVDELMEISTLIISKAGGMTTSESLAKGLPMVIVNPLPGQERRNTDFLLKNGIAVCIDKNGDIVEEVELLLKSPEKQAAMRQAAFKHGRPQAAMNIARLILQEEATAAEER